MIDHVDRALRWVKVSSFALAALIVVLVNVYLFQTINEIRDIESDIQDTQECIIGTLLVLPDQRRDTPGPRFDELCGFDPGNADKLRSFFDAEIP